MSAQFPRLSIPQTPCPLPKTLRYFWAASAGMIALTLIVTWVKYCAGIWWGLWVPLVDARYSDLTMLLPVYQHLHTVAFYSGRVGYPPLGAVTLAALYATGHPVREWMATAAIWLATGVWGVRWQMIRHGIRPATATLFPITLILLSFPIMGLLQRCNIELYLWIFAATGTWAFLRGRSNAAAVLWGLAAAMKLYPLILLGLLLPRRQWRAFVLGITTFAATTALSLRWLGPTMAVAWRGIMSGLFGYQDSRVSQWTLHEIMPNHSAFGLAKVAMLVAGLPVNRLTLPYFVCGGTVMGVTFFARLWKMPVVNQLLAVSTFMLMFPPISYFYTLVNLYAPLLMLLTLATRAERAGVHVAGLRGTVLLSVPLFAPFTLFTYPSVYLYGGLVQSFLLVILFACALQYPFAIIKDAEAGLL